MGIDKYCCYTVTLIIHKVLLMVSLKVPTTNGEVYNLNV